MSIPLSVLDFDQDFKLAPVLGPLVESLRYRRYWFAEHPPQPNAELFIALLAGLTDSLRVGSGGIVLRLRNIAQSARNFGFLVDAFGDRIDAGFCGGGAPPSVESELSEPGVPPVGVEVFDRRATDWVARLRSPQGRRLPEIWSLGTGLGSATRAASQGLYYAYSLFHRSSVDDVRAMDAYRELFKPSPWTPTPRTMLAFSGLCAPTDDAANRRLAQREYGHVRPTVWGSPSTCAEQLARLVARYRPDELIVLELSRSMDEKKESLTLWAEIVGQIRARDGA